MESRYRDNVEKRFETDILLLLLLLYIMNMCD